jgi:hypothetical protein
MQERRDLADVAALLAAIELPPDLGRTCSAALLLESKARVPRRRHDERRGQ